MNRRLPHPRILTLLCSLFLVAPNQAQTPAALTAFDTYIHTLESRLELQHRSPNSFLAPATPQAEATLRHGTLVIEQLPTPTLPGALLHHWRGTAFAPGAHAADFDRLLRDIPAYPQHFAPEVLHATALQQDADHLQATLRVRQKHILTVVLDTAYDITFGRLDPQHGYTASRSTHITEVDTSEDHGFLYRQNTYWTYEERDGGLYLQIESVSLTRSIPRGLSWAISPFVDSIPRESLDFTLRSTLNALPK